MPVTMKPLQILLAAFLLSGATTHGSFVTTSGTLNTLVPDANPTGISSTINVSGVDSPIYDVSVLLNMSGGANGDLYAYLIHENSSVILLNRIGKTAGDPFGSATAGFDSSFRFNDAGLGGDIHLSSGVPGSPITGAYQPDGRTADPQLVTDASPRGSLLASSFNGQTPNGDWILFIADMASGGGSSPPTLVSWGLEFNLAAVPEPPQVMTCIFLVSFGSLAVLIRRLFRKRKS